MSSPRPLDPDSPEALVHSAARGDADAFARIVRLHHVAMTRIALLVTGDLGMAVQAVAGAWPTAWSRLADLREPDRLASWLGSIAAGEALFLALHGRTRDVVAAAPAGVAPSRAEAAPSDPALVAILGDLRPEDRSLLARHHLAGLDPEELARRPSWAGARIRTRLVRLSARVAGPVVPATPEAVAERARDRLRAHVDVPVLPVDADRAARTARAEASVERGRLVSVAICAVVGLLVAAVPLLVPLADHH